MTSSPSQRSTASASQLSSTAAAVAAVVPSASLMDTASLSLLRGLRGHFTQRRECILTRASKVILVLLKSLLDPQSKEGSAESEDDDDAMSDDDDDFAVQPAQSASSSFAGGASASDSVADGIVASTEYQKLILRLVVTLP